MLTFGWGEILLIVGIIIIVVGPKDLPKLIKQFSSFTRSIKKLSREFKNSFRRKRLAKSSLKTRYWRWR